MKTNLSLEKKFCEVCGSKNLHKVLDLGEHALCDDLVPIDETRTLEKYPIQVLFCKDCKTAHQACQPSKKLLFPETYHYRSRFTLDVLNGMKELVESVEEFKGSLNNLKVIDIGCNDGSLLDIFENKGCKTYGIEPTAAVKDIKNDSHKIINDFFSAESSKKIKNLFGKFDIITFTNVFAHIDDLNLLLKNIEYISHENTLLVIENHYLGSILEKNQFDTFYHEHPRTYSLNSFISIADKLNKKLTKVSFPSRYGGNIRVFIGSNSSSDPTNAKFINDVCQNELTFVDKFNNLSLFIQKWKRVKLKEIKNILETANTPLVAKAYPGRAAILINILGLDENILKCIYEKPGSKKIDHYVPGTKIPIVSDEHLFKDIKELKFILNLAWHIPNEIERYLREKGFTGKLINIL